MHTMHELFGVYHPDIGLKRVIKKAGGLVGPRAWVFRVHSGGLGVADLCRLFGCDPFSPPAGDVGQDVLDHIDKQVFDFP